jgi:hypothetical protein
MTLHPYPSNTICACDHLECSAHDPRMHRCEEIAECVVVLLYRNRPGAVATLREVPLALCTPCAKWWVETDHADVTATYQVQPKAVAR